MASLIDELIMVLEEETGCYQELLNMADNKTDVIIKGDVPSLQEITKKEQVMAGHILRLEKKRKQNLEDICLVLNKKAKDVTLSSLIGLLPENESRRLGEIQESLSATILVLKEKNSAHGVLIQQSIDYIDFTVNAVRSMTSAPVGNSYAAKGQRYDEKGGRNFFDAKQ